jgi:diguanylate cyclase (GGDEF)-like protein
VTRRQQPASLATNLPRIAGLDLIAELSPDPDRTSYRARRYGVECLLTLFDGDSADTLRRLKREASLLAELGHPRLPVIYEVGQLGDRPYLVTEQVSGRPLADLIAGDPLSVVQAMRVVLDVVEPLAAMHGQGLVHGGLGSRQLIVLADESARLNDTGIANERPNSLGYLAPEQSGALARPVDNRTDLYSLGVVLFECLTGTLPFLAEDRSALAELQARTSAADPRTLVSELPESLALLVTTLLARDPGDRYQSGAELATDLRLLLGETLTGSDTLIDAPKLFGREHELDLINELWDQVRRGRGCGISLRGAAGVGKTRVIDEVLRQARRTGTPVLSLACRSNEPEPLGPLRRAVEELIRDADDLPAEQRSELLAQIRAAAGSAAPLLAGLSPALGDLLGVGALPEIDRQDQFAAAVSRFITELARLSGCLVMVTDDADLIDPSMLRMLSNLAGVLADVPILSIGSARTDRPVLFAPTDPMLPALRAGTDLDLVLEPLADSAVNDLLVSCLPGLDLNSPLARRLRDNGGGNPFVLLTQLRAIIDAGLLRPHWGSWRLDDGAEDQPAFPDEPLGLVLAGLATLEPATHRVLVVAAVTGLRFRTEDVAAIGALVVEETFTALAEAAGRGFIDLIGKGEYRFRHPRIPHALLLGVDPGELARLHRSTAEVLEPLLDPQARWYPSDAFAIAQHWLLGGPTGNSPEPGFEICRNAGQLALRAHAPGQAATFLEHADQLRPADPELLFTWGTALHQDGQYQAARQRLEEALLVERDALRRARILLRLTEVHRATRNTPKATTTIAWGLAELDAPLPDGRLLRALGAIRAGLIAFFISRTGWGFGTARSRNRERQALLTALHLIGGHLAGANLRPGSLVMHRLYGTRAAARLGSGIEYSVSCAAIGLTAARYGLHRVSRRSLARAEQAAAEVGDPQLVAQVAWYSGAANYLGRVDNGERWIQCLADHGQWLNSEQSADTISAVCWDAAVQGRNDDVQRWVESGRTRRAFRDARELTSLLTVPAIGLTAADQPAAANAELSRLRATLEEHGGRSLRVNLVLAELYALLEQDHLGEHFDAVVERFFEFGLSTSGMLRQHQTFYPLYAKGRLAQCRATPATARVDPARLEAARLAVRRLRSVANTPLLAAAHQQCRAELLILQGNPKRALTLLARQKPQREDAPLLGFEIAVTTARALLATGYPADARRQVLNALNLAEEHGWTGRRSRLAAEFGLPSVAAEPAYAVPPEPMDGLRELVAAAGRVLPDGRAWLIRQAPQTSSNGTGALVRVLFAELPAVGTVCELIFDPQLRSLTAARRPVVGDSDTLAVPQLRRLLAGSASWLLFPLICDGAPVGVLVLASARSHAYTDAEITAVDALAAHGMAAHAKAGLIARLQELTGIDELTGVRSLRQIIELATRDVQGARNSAQPLVVLVIGIDHLGRINDLHGRATGDDVIRQVANRLRQVIRETDLIGRYRQDEFVVVLSQGRYGEDGIGDGGLEVAERLLRTVSNNPLLTRVGPLPVTVTIGLTLMIKDDANFASLTSRAEVALQAAKHAGRNQVRAI